MTLRQEQWSGPLPSPRDLAEFERVIPGAAAKIFTQFEKQLDHRIDQESRVVRANIRSRYAGLGIGGIVAMLGFWVVRDIALRGHDVAAAMVGIAEIVGLAGAVVSSKWLDRDERRERRAERERIVREMRSARNP